MDKPFEINQVVEYEPTGEDVTVLLVQPVLPLHPDDPPAWDYVVETATGERIAAWGSKLNAKGSQS